MKIIITNITFVLAFLTLSTTIHAQRNTLWLRGTSQNSNGWSATRSYMSNQGFDFDDLVLSTTYQPGLGVEAGSGVLGLSLEEDEDDILVIAHDYGGLVARKLQLQEPKITAMILNGVPNHGSSAIDFATVSDPGDISRAQKLVDRIQLIQGEDDCGFCNLVAPFEEWVTSLNAGSAYLCDAKTNSPIIEELSENPPTVPHAILYGTVEDFSISRLMSSNAFPSDGDYLTECYTRALEDARQKTDDDEIRSTINNVTGFFGFIANLVGSLLPTNGQNGPTPPSPASVISAVVTAINGIRTSVLQEIQAVRDKDRELARILRCEFSNQLLAAEWELAMMENSLETEDIIVYQTEAECRAWCDGIGYEDFELEFICIPECIENPVTRTILVAEDNDGLLTESEQMLAGASGVYHLPETNHFQETSVFNTSLTSALRDIFEGEAGAAFVVPTN